MSKLQPVADFVRANKTKLIVLGAAITAVAVTTKLASDANDAETVDATPAE